MERYKNKQRDKKIRSYLNLKDRVMNNSNPEEKDWLKLEYEDKMNWMNKFGKVPVFL